MDQWKMHSSVQKEYDALSKTYVYNVGGKSPMAHMCLPKDKNKKLKLYFPLLVLQLCFPVKANLLCNIGITSCNSQRKRITLSSNQKSKQNSSLFTVLPFIIENSNKWINVLVDIEDIVATMWNNLKLKEINFLSLSGVFRLKRVFLLSRDLVNITEDVHDTSSSRSSSRSSLNNERIRTPEVNQLTLLNGSRKFATNFLTPKNLGKCEMFEDALNLNLSMLTFSEETELKTQDVFDSQSLPVQKSTESNPYEGNLNVTVRDNEQDIELWMPLSNSNKNDYHKKS